MNILISAILIVAICLVGLTFAFVKGEIFKKKQGVIIDNTSDHCFKQGEVVFLYKKLDIFEKYQSYIVRNEKGFESIVNNYDVKWLVK